MNGGFPGCSNEAASRLLHERARDAQARRIADLETVEARSKVELERHWEQVRGRHEVRPTMRDRVNGVAARIGRWVRMMFT